MDFNEIDLNERKLNMKTTVDITETKELNSEEIVSGADPDKMICVFAVCVGRECSA